jgi:Flp pilus assembly protein TadG
MHSTKFNYIKHFRPTKGGEQGASLIELALVLPVLITLLTGLINMGQWLQLHEQLARAATEGARYGALLPTFPPCDPDCNSQQHSNASVSQRVTTLLQSEGVQGTATIRATRRSAPSVPALNGNPPSDDAEVVIVQVSIPFTPILDLPPFRPSEVSATRQVGYVGGS